VREIIMGFFSSSVKYTEAWCWEGTPETSEKTRDSIVKNLSDKYGIDRRSVKFFSLDHAMSEGRRMRDLRAPTPLPDYDDVLTQEAAWNVISNGGRVIWHEKGDRDDDWPKHNFMKFTKL
jgi:hypothetical protein